MKVFLAVLAASLANGQRPHTVLDEQFCQVYYNLDDGNCEALRGSVRSEIRGEGTPTLELGDPSEKPVLVFFHGWPDTHALWANQFARFCGEGGGYACVAPSMQDYNPDVQPADSTELNWPRQAEILHEVVKELDLKNITLVLHDFGSIVGSMYVFKYPDFVQRVVNMDVANNPTASFRVPPPSEDVFNSLFFFQKDAITAFRMKNDTLMAQNYVFAPGILSAPCSNCKIAPNSTGPGYRTGWMHNNFVNDDPPWTMFFEEDYADFEFAFTPSWPDHVPVFFLWAFEDFHTPDYLTFLDGRGDGSRHVHVGEDHWFMTRSNVTNTNDLMAEFLDDTDPRCDFCGENTICVNGMCHPDPVACAGGLDVCCKPGEAACGATGGTIWPDTALCVCVFDSWCCEYQWDAQCITEASTACGMVC